MSEESAKTRAVFDWAAVDARTARGLLTAYALDTGQPLAAGELRRRNGTDLTFTAERNLGRPPIKSKMAGDHVIDFLRHRWLPTQSAECVEEVVDTLSTGLRNKAPYARAERLKYIRKLNRTSTLALALRHAFIRAYKEDRPVRPTTPIVDALHARSEFVLRGTGAEPEPLHEHQQQAQVALDDWFGTSRTGGVVVLPTGSGKTRTAVTWLLGWMAHDQRRRVLWLAHQRELVEQAAREFVRQAATQPPDFSRRMRVIHGAGSSMSTLSEKDLSIAVATMQTVRPDGDPKRTEALQRFASGPTIVVVDEAHRAPSATYAELLDVVHARRGTRILGLTATPFPTGESALRRFRKRFPRTLIQVEPSSLVKQGILARPVFHRIDTHLTLTLSPEQIRKATNLDLPDDVLGELAAPVRNRLIVDRWVATQETWGKTLVFATSIDHAEVLARDFLQSGVAAKAVHSMSRESLPSVLAWFRDEPGACVLVSVGMLTEGVDLPGAQTAFLARPTTSAVLVQQMVGRVLRGPKARGTAVAHLVTLHDDWSNFTGVIEPVDLRTLPEEDEPEGGTGGTEKFRIVTASGAALPAGVRAQIERLYAEHAAAAAQGSFVASAELVGYYELTVTRIPVFRHQIDGFTDLIDNVLAGASLQGRPPIRYFADDPLPHPIEKHLSDLVREVRDLAARPAFVDCRVVAAPLITARRLRELATVSEKERLAIIHRDWEESGRLAFPTVDHWHEAVDAAYRELVRRDQSGRTVADPEQVPVLIKAPEVERDLQTQFYWTVATAYELLDSADMLERLDDLPDVRWSGRPLRTAHAHWRRASKGPTITVSRGLRVNPEHVSDMLLRYLLWHELLHHVLPGHGHDAEFRTLEARWPNALDLDRELDTLHERLG